LELLVGFKVPKGFVSDHDSIWFVFFCNFVSWTSLELHSTHLLSPDLLLTWMLVQLRNLNVKSRFPFQEHLLSGHWVCNTCFNPHYLILHTFYCCAGMIIKVCATCRCRSSSSLFSCFSVTRSSSLMWPCTHIQVHEGWDPRGLHLSSPGYWFLPTSTSGCMNEDIWCLKGCRTLPSRSLASQGRILIVTLAVGLGERPAGPVLWFWHCPLSLSCVCSLGG
jgi:hypothetical protein